MREGGEDKLRIQPPGAEPSSERTALPRGVFLRRVCLCIKCGSDKTIVRGSPKGQKYMHCMKCGVNFKAANG